MQDATHKPAEALVRPRDAAIDEAEIVYWSKRLGMRPEQLKTALAAVEQRKANSSWRQFEVQGRGFL